MEKPICWRVLERGKGRDLAQNEQRVHDRDFRMLPVGPPPRHRDGEVGVGSSSFLEREKELKSYALAQKAFHDATGKGEDPVSSTEKTPPSFARKAGRGPGSLGGAQGGG